MTASQFFMIMFMGVFANNMVTVSGTGADLAMNRSNTLTNSLILGGLTAGVIFISTIVNYLVKVMLVTLEVQNISILVSVFVIAVLAQIVELLGEKIFPKFMSELKYVPVFLACSCAVVSINIQIYSGFNGFLEVFLSAIFYSIGVCLSLVLIGGIRRSLKFREIPYGCEKTVVSLLILFILTLAFQAFV